MSAQNGREPFALNLDESADLAIRLSRGGRRLVRDLVRVREQHDLTRSEVADAIGIHKSGVSRFERQEKSPRLDTLLRYAHSVGADVTFSVVPVDGWHCEDANVVTRVHTWGRGLPDCPRGSGLKDDRVEERKIAVRL